MVVRKPLWSASAASGKTGIRSGRRWSSGTRRTTRSPCSTSIATARVSRPSTQPISSSDAPSVRSPARGRSRDRPCSRGSGSAIRTSSVSRLLMRVRPGDEVARTRAGANGTRGTRTQGHGPRTPGDSRRRNEQMSRSRRPISGNREVVVSQYVRPYKTNGIDADRRADARSAAARDPCRRSASSRDRRSRPRSPARATTQDRSRPLGTGP